MNLEYLARVVEDRDGVAFPDTLVGTDSHTTMVNGLGVLGWGVGGIEAEAAMLGEPLSMLVPQVVGFRLSGALPEGATATDLVLTVTEMLRKTGVVGKFVEYFGEGLAALPLADRATLGNMSPEYGATCGFFPVDEHDARLPAADRPQRRSGSRSSRRTARRTCSGTTRPTHATYSQVVELDLGDVEPSLAGPRRPQDRVPLARAKECVPRGARHVRRRLRERLARQAVADTFPATRPDDRAGSRAASREPRRRRVAVATRRGRGHRARPRRRRRLRARPRLRRDRRDHLVHEHVEPAGDGRRRPAREEGASSAACERKPWVKSSLAPGSKVVTEYYEQAGLAAATSTQLGFNTVGYGCTTCIGNSGPAAPTRSRRRSPRATSSSARCSPATATSRRASTPR